MAVRRDQSDCNGHSLLPQDSSSSRSRTGWQPRKAKCPFFSILSLRFCFCCWEEDEYHQAHSLSLYSVLCSWSHWDVFQGAWLCHGVRSTYAHVKQAYAQRQMDTCMDGLTHTCNTHTHEATHRDTWVHLWEQGGGPRTFSVRFQVLTVSAFVPFRTPWHAMVRHGTPCASASFAPLFQVWVSWIPVGCQYIYITFQVAVQVLAALGQKIRK